MKYKFITLLLFLFVWMFFLKGQITVSALQLDGCGLPDAECNYGPMCYGPCVNNYCASNPFCAVPEGPGNDPGDGCVNGCQGQTRWYECEACAPNPTNPPPGPSPTPITNSETILLGRVKEENSNCSGPDTQGFYVFGKNCSSNSCWGETDYTISWWQASKSGTVPNNGCNPSPNFNTNNSGSTRRPDGTVTGVDTIINVSLNDILYYTATWDVGTTDGNGVECHHQSGVGLPVHAKLYKDGSCNLNHLHIVIHRVSCTWFDIVSTPGGTLGYRTMTPAGTWKRVAFDGHPASGTFVKYQPTTGADANWWTEGYNDSSWSNQGYVYWDGTWPYRGDYYPIPSIGNYAWLAQPKADHITDIHRRPFTLPTNYIMEAARLIVFSDNGSHFWINGNEVVHGGAGYSTYYFNKNNIRPGNNLLAVQLSNQTGPMGVQYILQACANINPATPTPSLPAWSITRGGDSFVKTGVDFGDVFMQNTLKRTTVNNTNLTAYGFNAAETPYFATYNYLQQSQATGSFPADCTRCSGISNIIKKYLKNGYDDANDTPAGGWYDYLQKKLTASGFIDQTFTVTQPYPASIGTGGTAAAPVNFSTGLTDTDNNGFYVVDIQGNLDVGTYHTCDKKIIFLVRGNANFRPNLLASNNSTGCIFIVGGSTTVANAGAPRAASGQNVYYDILNAFFITNSFADSADVAGSEAEGLLIKGGLVANTVSFNRDVRVKTLFSPAELIIFDDRYLVLFNTILDEPIDFSVREKQFINTLLNP